MQTIKVIKAQLSDAPVITMLVEQLLIELAPETINKLADMSLDKVTETLMQSHKIEAFLAYQGESPIGVITLHQCAAIYAGGIFGEISELYVKPQYRSLKVGEKLINEAVQYAKSQNWQRIEVGTPPPNDSPRTLQFYEQAGFKATGTRMRYLVSKK